MLKLSKGLLQYWKYLIIVFIAIIGQGFTMLLVPDLMSKIINEGIIITDGVANANYAYIFQVGAVMLGVSVLSVLSAVGAGFGVSKIVTQFGANLRAKVFNQVQRFTMKEYGKFGAASLITRTTNDVTQIQNVLFMLLRFGLMIPIMFVGGIILTISKSLIASSVLFVAIPVLVIAAFLVGRKVFKLFEIMQKKIDNLTLVMRENLSGVRVIRAFNREESEYHRFDKANKDVRDVGIKANRIMAYMVPSVNLIINISILSVVLIIGNDIRVNGTNETDVGNMLAIIEYISQIMMSVVMVAMIFVMVPRASASAERINEVLDVEPSIVSGGNEDCIMQNEISFNNVFYKYDNADGYVLEDINFKGKCGEVIGVIGSTGSGKSTLMGLLPRMYDCTDGNVTIDGVDVRDLPLEKLRDQIGFVPQKSVLFKGTIESNLKYGKEDATEDEIIEALKIAQAYDFVMKKEGGLKAGVEQGGSNFSGGQKQRLAIARALVRKPRIYIFDDSFSALDNATDLKLRKALRKNVKDALTIIISSRIGTISDANRILVLDDGKIVGEGTHKQLIKNCEVYNEIAYSQLSKEEVENA